MQVLAVPEKADDLTAFETGDHEVGEGFLSKNKVNPRAWSADGEGSQERDNVLDLLSKIHRRINKMSKALYIGFDKALSKVEYSKEEIFADFKFSESLYVQDGILFDGAADGLTKNRIGRSFGYTWYEVKAVVLPFECESRLADSMPDYYLAAYRITEWFINFLREQISCGNMPHLLQRWLGDKDIKKAERKTLKHKDLRCEDYSLPYDVLLNIR
ncbi:MAG: hypothetical protein LUD19_06115 [Clostridia bacterium]|nr:hypothetical protein [Clostridia bacterium]